MEMEPFCVNPVPRTYVRDFRACPSGTSEHSPREIAARGAFKVMTEEIISRGHPCTYVQGVLWYGVNVLPDSCDFTVRGIYGDSRPMDPQAHHLCWFSNTRTKRPSQSEFTGKRLPCVKQATDQAEWFEGIDRIGLIGAVSICTNEL